MRDRKAIPQGEERMDIAPAVPEWLVWASAFTVGGLAVAMLAHMLDALIELG